MISIVLKDGTVSSVINHPGNDNGPLEIAVINHNIEGVPDEELEIVHYENGDKAKAIISIVSGVEEPIIDLEKTFRPFLTGIGKLY